MTLEARKRGALVRPLGDVVVLMPPLAISEAELESLLDITARSIDRRPRLAPRCRAARRLTRSHFAADSADYCERTRRRPPPALGRRESTP